MKKNFIKKKGFTLIEVIVVFTIIAILMLTVFIDYRVKQKNFALLRSAYKLTQDIRKVSEMALSAKECPTSVCGSDSIKGYSIEFEKDDTFYIIFFDLKGSGKYNASKDKLISRENLEQGIKIKKLYVSNDGGTFSEKNNIDITFKPPVPQIFIRESGDYNYAKIEIESDTGQTKTININSAGLIEIVD